MTAGDACGRASAGRSASAAGSGGWSAARSGGLEEQRRDDGPRCRCRLVVLGVRPVEQVPAVNEGRGPSAVEVDGLRGAERDEQPRQLGQLQAGVHPRATAVAADREQLVLADPQSAPRVAADGDVGVELRCAAREPLVVLIVVTTRPSRTRSGPACRSRRAGLSEARRAGRPGPSRQRARTRGAPRVRRSARARRPHRRRAPRRAAGTGRDEEARHDRLGVPPARTPVVEPAGFGEALHGDPVVRRGCRTR